MIEIVAHGILQVKRDEWKNITRGDSSMKRCIKCKKVKPLDQFPNSKLYIDGKSKACKLCARVRKYTWKGKAMTGRDFYFLLEIQNYTCPICLSPLDPDSRATHIDHNHETNEVRGILCRSCNVKLGTWGNPRILRRALDYVQSKGWYE